MGAAALHSFPILYPETGRQVRQHELPDYLPARMVNEHVYCPRLFFYEFVDSLFRESVDTLEGAAQHKRVDSGTGALPSEGESEEAEQKIHSRSVTLASERYKVIAKMDLVEVQGGTVTPVDYKHGKPRPGPEGELEMWPTDRVQLGIQGLILRENGYRCEEVVAYYSKTKQKARIALDEALQAETEAAIAQAWETARRGVMPRPLEDSPKCPGCSMAGICLPDETNWLLRQAELQEGPEQLDLFAAEENPPRRRPAAREIMRQLVTPRSEQKAVYLNTQGLRVGKSGEVLQVKEKETVVQQIRLGEVCQLNVMGNIQVTTQATQALCEAGVPVCYFSMGGWFYGITSGMNTKNVFLRRSQFRLAESEGFCVQLARTLVAGKIRNQRVMLQRNHVEPRALALAALKQSAEDAESASSLPSLLGIEGNAARVYFGELQGMIKVGDEDSGGGGGDDGAMRFDFRGRNRRPPKDSINALLSLAYSVLAKDLTVACYAVGFDPFLGFYHQPRFGRPALALDLMEPFRPLIAESAVLSAVNMRMVTARDFVKAGDSVALTASGRKGFFRAYEARMDTMVTHPLFDYRVTYRRLLEIQSRLLARVLEGEIGAYPVFVTR